MKEITQQVREQIFALYRGSDAIAIHPPKDQGYPFDENERGLKVAGVLNGRIIIQRIAEDVEDIFNQCALHLATLEDISDEDAIEVARMTYPRYYFESDLGCSMTGRDVLKPLYGEQPEDHRMHGIEIFPVFDYLRSKGYALPFLHWSISDLVSAGVYKLKTK